MQFIWNEWLHCENPKMSAHYCFGLCVSVCCSFRCFCIEPQIGLASSCHCCQFPNGYTFLFHCKHFVHFILGFLILSISSRFSQAVPKELLAKFTSFWCTYDPSWTQCTLVFNVSGFFLLPAYIFRCCVSPRSPHLICKHINLRRNSFFFSPSLSVFVCVRLDVKRTLHRFQCDDKRCTLIRRYHEVLCARILIWLCESELSGPKPLLMHYTMDSQNLRFIKSENHRWQNAQQSRFFLLSISHPLVGNYPFSMAFCSRITKTHTFIKHPNPYSYWTNR